MSDLVDVIFLDIDGVLLPFGGTRDKYHNDKPCTDGCLFPDSTMEALTTLIQRIRNLSINNNTSCQTVIQGNPVLVLSSTWRARPEFIQDILSSFNVYAQNNEDASILQTWKESKCLDSFFDITDPNYHSTRQDEIMKWVEKNVVNVKGKRKNNNSQCTTCSSKTAKKQQQFIVRSWIALDDEDLINVEGNVTQHSDIMKQHAVQTKSSVGLTLEDTEFGVQLIQKQIYKFHDGTFC